MVEGFNADDIQRICDFIRVSERIPQLATARSHAVLVLRNLIDSGGLDRYMEANFTSGRRRVSSFRATEKWFESEIKAFPFSPALGKQPHA
jgi:hypothetical protein